MGSSGFPVDLVLFGMIAAFLVLRLRSILGRRTGFEPGAGPARAARTAPPTIEGRAEAPSAPARAVPEPASELGQTLQRMQRIDANLTPERFLAGAEAAFRLIVAEFAAGHRDALRPLLTAETFALFDEAITAREAAGHRRTADIKSIHEASIETASLTGTIAEIGVRFVSDQVNQTLDRDGKYVDGTDAVMELRDVWTFTRDLARSDPAWKLAQTRSA